MDESLVLDIRFFVSEEKRIFFIINYNPPNDCQVNPELNSILLKSQKNKMGYKFIKLSNLVFKDAQTTHS